MTPTEGGDGLLGNSFTVAPVCVLLCHVISHRLTPSCLPGSAQLRSRTDWRLTDWLRSWPGLCPPVPACTLYCEVQSVEAAPLHSTPHSRQHQLAPYTSLPHFLTSKMCGSPCPAFLPSRVMFNIGLTKCWDGCMVVCYKIESRERVCQKLDNPIMNTLC